MLNSQFLTLNSGGVLWIANDRLADYQRVIDIVRRANDIAASTELDALLDQMLDLFVEVASAEAGTLYLYDADTDELIFKVVKGDPHSQRLIGTRFPAARGIAGAALRAQRADLYPRCRARSALGSAARRAVGPAADDDVLPAARAARSAGRRGAGLQSAAGAVDEDEELAVFRLLGNRMVSEIQKARLLGEAQRREKRMSALVDIISHLTTTLDRDSCSR